MNLRLSRMARWRQPLTETCNCFLIAWYAEIPDYLAMSENSAGSTNQGSIAGGVLIIGSLFWDPHVARAKWRQECLDLPGATAVRAPIRYSRMSSTRKNTYTMVFSGNSPDGWAIFVPFIKGISDFGELTNQARALWVAESNGVSPPNAISAKWGCVGAVFRSGGKAEGFRSDWEKVFRQQKKPDIAGCNEHGALTISWPTRQNFDPIATDVILATSNNTGNATPSAVEIADAWIERGAEDYFFNNVAHDIRTSQDLDIWKRIEIAGPDFLRNPKYSAAIATLKKEVSPKNGPSLL